MSVAIVGDAFVDIALPVHSIQPGKTYHRNMLVGCGGTANVAIQLAKAGERVKFVGKVGNDALGRYFKETLRRNGVEDITFVDDACQTGLCICLVYQDGERSMVADRGANDYLTKEEVEPYLRQIREAQVVYFSGYSLVTQRNAEAINYIAQKCSEGNRQICFNPGASNTINEEVIHFIHKFADILLLNLEEAKSIAGKNGIDGVVSKISKLVSLAVITMGREGCVVVKEGGHTFVKTKAITSAIDTTGAGDAFSAGFLLGILRHMGEIKSAQLGHEMATNFLKEKVRLDR